MGSVEAALRIARATGGTTITPSRALPFGDSLNIPDAPTKAQMDKYSYHQDVPLDKARATQSTMDWRAENKRANPGPLIKGYADKPVAVRKESGEYLVYDGHHRSVMAKNDAKDYDPANAGRPPARQGMSDDDLMKELGFNSGGRIARADGGSVAFAGPINSEVSGRTDHLPLTVNHGSYVLPADVVSSFGEGNTAAAFKVLRRLFGGDPYEKGTTPYDGVQGPYNEPLSPKASGGAATGVPIVAAGGEYVLSPLQVRLIGEGDLDSGHRVLDEFVKRQRDKLIKTLQKLPGPKKS